MSKKTICGRRHQFIYYKTLTDGDVLVKNFGLASFKGEGDLIPIKVDIYICDVCKKIKLELGA